MAIRPYLAMTAEEIANTAIFSHNTAQIYCPFSRTELCPSNTDILVLTDSTPVVYSSVNGSMDWLDTVQPEMLILDFQRPPSPDGFAFIKMLLADASVPIFVSDTYAAELDCAVFLSPVPPYTRLADHIHPWLNRNICLDISTEGAQLQVTQTGTKIAPLPRFQNNVSGFCDTNLHCHYSISLSDDAAEFFLWRTNEDITDLLTESEALGIQHTIGLYQELG